MDTLTTIFCCLWIHHDLNCFLHWTELKSSLSWILAWNFLYLAATSETIDQLTVLICIWEHLQRLFILDLFQFLRVYFYFSSTENFVCAEFSCIVLSTWIRYLVHIIVRCQEEKLFRHIIEGIYIYIYSCVGK